MSSHVQMLLDKFEAKGLLLDANLLLLDLVGGYDRRLIGDGKYNKLSKYQQEDLSLLLRLKRNFRRLVTTSHVLTEVSNLTGDLPETTRTLCFDQFSELLTGTEELTLPAAGLMSRPEFRFLGLTDTGLAQVCEQVLVVSDDARMVARINQSGREALNFNYLRSHLFRDL